MDNEVKLAYLVKVVQQERQGFLDLSDLKVQWESLVLGV